MNTEGEWEMKPYPLKFRPALKERVWGGRALERFGLELPDGPIGEAWTVADHANGVSVIANGELAGHGLDDARKRFGGEWLGEKYEAYAESRKRETGVDARFPLLVKLLDCNDDLSVQVHPSDDYANLPPGEPGKTEMWYVLDAKPGAKIIYGLKPGWTRETFAEAIRENRVMEALESVEARPGDTFFIPSGTVHALCAGVLVAEIQQNSDTTYRIYDYDRPGLDGKPRELHIEDSLNVIRYDNAGARHARTDLDRPHEWLELARCTYFVTEKALVNGQWTIGTFPDTFSILINAEGEGTLAWADGEISLAPGDCVLLPANLGDCELRGRLTVLRSRLP
jgi:mannose-6-phosphate isomerase